MTDLLAEYKAYYRTRANRYAQDPDYQHTFEAENKLAEAMESCQELEAFRNKVGNLNELCAIALVKDDAKLEYKLYTELKENIRKLGPERILDKADQCSTAQEIITLVQEELNKNSVEIAMDELVREAFHDWSGLEYIDELENAIVPNHRKAENQKQADKKKVKMKANIEELEDRLKEWEENWKVNLDLIWEERHFRLLPYPKEAIEKRFREMRAIINR